MSARRGSLTLTRLYVNGAPPRDFRHKYLQAIRLRAFQPLKPEEEPVEASGWCVMERPFELEFDAGNVYEDHFILLGLRIDRYRIPGSVIRSQLADEEQKLLTRSGKNRVSRNERLELRDKIVLKLRKKFPPSTRSLDVVWDVDKRCVLFFSHSRRVLADFCALFEKTFGLQLREDSPYLAAERAGLPERLTRRLQEVAPLRLSKSSEPEPEPAAQAQTTGKSESKPGKDGSEEATDELFQRVETTRFLGPEFLLWLWLRGEFVEGSVELGEREFDVWLDRQLVLESPLDKNERVTIRGAAPADGEEAREAVHARKFPVRARIVLQSPERDFALGLDAPRFAISGATVPSVLNSDASEAFLERMQLAEQLFDTLDQLYALYLRDRLGEAWEAAWEPAIRAWVNQQPPAASVLQQLNPKPARRQNKRRSSAMGQ